MFDFTCTGAVETATRRAYAQPTPAPRGGLVMLRGLPFPVRTSRTSRAAGVRIAGRIRAALDLLEVALGLSPDLSLVVLDRHDWRRHADVAAYGVTHVAGNGELIVGAEPADAWHAVSDWFADHLAPNVLARVVAVHGIDESNGRGPALGALAETLVAHELAHMMAAQAGIAFPRRWLEEAFANHALVAVLGETDPAGLHRLGVLAEAAATLDTAMPALGEFEHEFGRMDVAASVLAELAITRAVYAAYAEAGAEPLARLCDALWDARFPRDADYELGRMLATRVHPAIAGIPSRFAKTRRASAVPATA